MASSVTVIEKAEILGKTNKIEAIKLYTNWLKKEEWFAKELWAVIEEFESQNIENICLEDLGFFDRIVQWPPSIARKKGDVTFRDEMNAIAMVYNNRGHLKYLRVDFEGAIQDYCEGLRYHSLLPCLYYNRGTIMYRMGHFDKAAEDMLVAARLGPDCSHFQVALQRTMSQLETLHGPLTLGSEEQRQRLLTISPNDIKKTFVPTADESEEEEPDNEDPEAGEDKKLSLSINNSSGIEKQEKNISISNSGKTDQNVSPPQMI